MSRHWMRRKGLPVLVFVAAALAADTAIVLRAHLARRAEIPVGRAMTSASADETLVTPDVVDTFIVENLRATGIPGALVAITRNGRMLHVAGYGRTADDAAVTPATPMPVASLTKSFTSAAVLLLAEQGKIRLDAPVRDYLPEFDLADPRAARITVVHLLSQTSGLANRNLPPRRSPAPQSLAEQLDWLRGATLVSEPGAEFNYCNENYEVLASLIERVRGSTFDRALEQDLFAPLGMHSSRVFATLGDPLPGVSAGHTLMFGVPVAREIPRGMGSGASGAVSSADDLARWLVFQSSGGITAEGRRLLPAASVAAMHTPSFEGSEYGFGWIRSALPDGTVYVHHSGRLPNFAAHQRLFPETGYGFAIVLNGMHPFNAEAASFIAGLSAIVTGHVPTTGPPFLVFGLPWGMIVDGIVATMIVLFAAIAFFGALRARSWAAHHRDVARWRLALRLVPYAVLSLGVAASPWLMSVLNRGQPVALALLFSQWPPLAMALVAAMIAGVTPIAFRCAWLLRAR